MDNGIRNLVFDFGGVLIDIDPRRCVEEFEKLGFGPAEELIGKYWQRGVFRDFELGNVSGPQRGRTAGDGRGNHRGVERHAVRHRTRETRTAARTEKGL